jgi:hypothetical protein
LAPRDLAGIATEKIAKSNEQTNESGNRPMQPKRCTRGFARPPFRVVRENRATMRSPP